MASIPLMLINPRATLRREQISEHDFCIVVDDFFEDPDRLVQIASQHPAEFANPNLGYPGVQLQIDIPAMKHVHRFVRSRLSKEFGFLRGRIGIRSLLSMLTLPPEELAYMQRICHIDPNPDVGRRKYGGLVYLFRDERLGGTSFFRWKDEELVWKGVDLLRTNADEGEKFFEQNFKTFREPPKYMTESNEIAQLLHTVSPRFNRFVFYPGDIPHSAAITAPELLAGGADKGRLTLNLFFSVLPGTAPSRAN